MEDAEIVDLFFQRSEQAIPETAAKYQGLIFQISRNILENPQDAEECVNDAYLAVWNGVPSAPPRSLLAYLAKVTRNIALKRLEHNQAQKRGDRYYLQQDELAEVLPGEDSVEDAVAQRELMEAINDFLKTKTDRGERQLFLRRYFWGDSIGELTVLFRHSESKVKSQLFRTRQRLRGYLEERGLLG